MVRQGTDNCEFTDTEEVMWVRVCVCVWARDSAFAFLHYTLSYSTVRLKIHSFPWLEVFQLFTWVKMNCCDENTPSHEKIKHDFSVFVAQSTEESIFQTAHSIKTYLQCYHRITFQSSDKQPFVSFLFHFLQMIRDEVIKSWCLQCRNTSWSLYTTNLHWNCVVLADIMTAWIMFRENIH